MSDLIVWGRTGPGTRGFQLQNRAVPTGSSCKAKGYLHGVSQGCLSGRPLGLVLCATDPNAVLRSTNDRRCKRDLSTLQPLRAGLFYTFLLSPVGMSDKGSKSRGQARIWVEPKSAGECGGCCGTRVSSALRDAPRCMKYFHRFLFLLCKECIRLKPLTRKAHHAQSALLEGKGKTPGGPSILKT